MGDPAESFSIENEFLTTWLTGLPLSNITPHHRTTEHQTHVPYTTLMNVGAFDVQVGG